MTLSSVQPNVGVALVASVSDPDGGVENVRWTWYRDSDAASYALLRAEDDATIIDSVTRITGATSDTYTPDKDDDLNAYAVLEGDQSLLPVG